MKVNSDEEDNISEQINSNHNRVYTNSNLLSEEQLIDYTKKKDFLNANNRQIKNALNNKTQIQEDAYQSENSRRGNGQALSDEIYKAKQAHESSLEIDSPDNNENYPYSSNIKSQTYQVNSFSEFDNVSKQLHMSMDHNQKAKPHISKVSDIQKKKYLQQNAEGKHKHMQKKYTQYQQKPKLSQVSQIQGHETTFDDQKEPNEKLNETVPHVHIEKASLRQFGALELIWLTVKKWHKDITCFREHWKLTKVHYELVGDKAYMAEDKRENVAIIKIQDYLMNFINLIYRFTKSIEVYSPDQGIIIIRRFCKNKEHFCVFKMFWVDMINASTIAFVMFLTNELLYIFFWFRVIQVSATYKILDEHFQITQRYPSFWTLVKLICQVLFVAHFVGCLFHTIAIYEIQFQIGETWLHAQEIVNEKWDVKYLYSVYFSLITMCTVGYGDISPVTNIERIFVIFSTVGSCGVFAYAINTIGQIFADIQKKKENFDHSKFQITKYMTQRLIDRNLQIKVLKYLDYIQDKEREDPKNGTNILNTVSKTLREQVQRDYFCKILQKSQFFNDNFSLKCLEEVSLFMQETMFGPGEEIFKKGETDKKIYFIVKGVVELYMETIDLKENKLLHLLPQGSFLGQTGFISGIERETSARSKNMSLIIYLSQDDFEKVLKQFPQDYEKYCEMRDEILLTRKIGKLKCYSCEKEGHSVLQCPLLHLVIRKSLFLTHSNRQIFQLRSNEKLRSKEKRIVRLQNEEKEDKHEQYKRRFFNAFMNQQESRKALRKYREILISEVQGDDPPSDFDNDIEDEDDHEFFMRCQKVEYENGKLRVIDFYSDDDISSDENEYIPKQNESEESDDSEEASDDSSISQSISQGSKRPVKDKHKNIFSHQQFFKEVQDEVIEEEEQMYLPVIASKQPVNNTLISKKSKTMIDNKKKIQKQRSLRIKSDDSDEDVEEQEKQPSDPPKQIQELKPPNQITNNLSQQFDQIQEVDDDRSSDSSSPDKRRIRKSVNKLTEEPSEKKVKFAAQTVEDYQYNMQDNIQSSYSQLMNLNATIKKVNDEYSDNQIDDLDMLMLFEQVEEPDPYKNLTEHEKTMLQFDACIIMDDDIDPKYFFQPKIHPKLMKKIEKSKKKRMEQSDESRKTQKSNTDLDQDKKNNKDNESDKKITRSDKKKNTINNIKDLDTKQSKSKSQNTISLEPKPLNIINPNFIRRGSAKPNPVIAFGQGSLTPNKEKSNLQGTNRRQSQLNTQAVPRRLSIKTDQNMFGRKQSIYGTQQNRKFSVKPGEIPIYGERRTSQRLQNIQGLSIMHGFPTQSGGLVNTRNQKKNKKRNKKNSLAQDYKDGKNENLSQPLIPIQYGQDVLSMLMELIPGLQNFELKKQNLSKRHGVDQELLKKQIENNNIPQKELFSYDMDAVKEFVNYNSHSNYKRERQKLEAEQELLRNKNLKQKKSSENPVKAANRISQGIV